MNNSIDTVSNSPDAMVNFHKELNRYLGYEKRSFDVDKMIEVINQHLIQKGYPDASIIRQSPCERLGKKRDVNLEILYTAMKECGYSEYYEDINRIAYRLLGWKEW